MFKDLPKDINNACSYILKSSQVFSYPNHHLLFLIVIYNMLFLRIVPKNSIIVMNKADFFFMFSDPNNIKYKNIVKTVAVGCNKYIYMRYCIMIFSSWSFEKG